MTTRKARLFWPILSILFFTDCGTKQLAEEHLSTTYMPYDVVGDVVRFSLAYNPGAAFGISLFGPMSRWALVAITIGIMLLLARLYRETQPHEKGQTMALALIFGGAIGNLIDRVRSPQGVVDFIDVGVGAYRWWTFNIADVGITLGALMLAWALWRREQEGVAAEPQVAETSQ
jgi:signal peptidase II